MHSMTKLLATHNKREVMKNVSFNNRLKRFAILCKVLLFDYHSKSSCYLANFFKPNTTSLGKITLSLLFLSRAVRFLASHTNPRICCGRIVFKAELIT